MKLPESLNELFKNWDDIINKTDFREYTCQNCNTRVKKFEDWVRGQTLCRGCFDGQLQQKRT